MDGIRQYILSVICIATLCGLVQMLFSSGNVPVVKLITGLIVTIVAVSPLFGGIDLQLNMNLDEIVVQNQSAVKEGEDVAMAAMSVLIKEEAESYILDKAAELGAIITVEVKLVDSMPPSPEYITIKGTLSPYAKKQLSNYIQQNLGVSEENQIWIS